MIWEEILKRFESGMLPFTWSEHPYTDAGRADKMVLGLIPALLELAGYGRKFRKKAGTDKLLLKAFGKVGSEVLSWAADEFITHDTVKANTRNTITLIKLLANDERNRKTTSSVALQDQEVPPPTKGEATV